VGDSRIYTVARDTFKLARVTVDDTLKEAFGGGGAELVQFIGIGPSILPRVDTLSFETDGVFLTSDGAHFIDPSLLMQVIGNAGDPIRAAERLVALSRWLGGPDNASVSAFRLSDITNHLLEATPSPAILWSGMAELQIAFPSEGFNRSDQRAEDVATTFNDSKKTPPQRTGRAGNKRKPKKQRTHQEPNQLEVKISTDETDDAPDS
jgi:serine/threonine protein phosphatase PrpC